MRIPGFSSYVCIVMVYITLFYFHAFADVPYESVVYSYLAVGIWVVVETVAKQNKT